MEPGRATFRALGTTADVSAAVAADLNPAVAAVRSELDAIDLACSRFRPDSDLERVNATPGLWVRVSSLLMEAVAVALRAAALTDGDVDPTVGASLIRMGYDRDFAALTSFGAPAGVPVPAPGWRSVQLDPAASCARIPPGVRLDLGATAKALAADRAARAAAEATGGGVLVSLGGDIAVAGDPPPEGWAVGLADAHDAPADPGASVLIASGGLATSSTTVRRWARGGTTHHHILDPRDGRPAAEVWRTVSVAAATCVDANIASTAAIIRGEAAPDWLEALGLPARLVRKDGRVERTAGWPQAVPA
jgi:FAD:protein FMN transferase